MSFWAQAMVAATKAVAAPMMATTRAASGDACNRGLTRQSRYTPAVTMVAAWMSADTGVGPSMASASQGKSGIWADLPTTPTSSSRQMAVTSAEPILSMLAKTVEYSSEWTLS